MEIVNKKIKYDETIADEISTEKNEISPERIIELYNNIISKSEEDIVKFYQPLFDQNREYEAFMTQTIHIELLLRKLISLKLNIGINDFARNRFNDLINIAFQVGLIKKEQGEKLNSIRNLRNKFAHEFLVFPSINKNEVIRAQGQNFIKIMELNEAIKQLENETKES